MTLYCITRKKRDEKAPYNKHIFGVKGEKLAGARILNLTCHRKVSERTGGEYRCPDNLRKRTLVRDESSQE